MISMALGCKVPQKIGFFRKNYFYPDLPKSFQITQYNAYGPTSIGYDGKVRIEDKEIRIQRIQLEEDPGRLVYEGSSEKTQVTLVDYNRAGTPLVEIVTEPDFETPKQVRLFLNLLADLVENLGVSDPSLEGALRVDGNISIDKGNRVEIKNVASFRDIEKALHFEITRQQSLAERNITIPSETRHWDEARKITVSARSKEEEQDYRYFPEADIPSILIDKTVIERLGKNMPESIISKKERYKKYGIPLQVAEVLSSDKFYSDLFERSLPCPVCGNGTLVREYDEGDTHKREFSCGHGGIVGVINELMNINERVSKIAKETANIITTDLKGFVDTNEQREQLKLTANHLSDLSYAILNNKITRNAAKVALQEIIKTGKLLSEIISTLDLGHIDDESSLSQVIDDVFVEEQKAVSEAKNNPDTINYLVGKVMKKTKGKANPALTLDLIKKRLDAQ